MAFDTVSLSSSDEDIPLKTLGTACDEDLPLTTIQALSYEPIKSAILKKHSLEHCDFCEEVFLNKYDTLIHNGKHIIIPLIKKEYLQCPLCLFYFTSRYKLKHHTRNKHKNDVNTEAVNPDTTKNIEKHNKKVIKEHNAKLNVKKDNVTPKPNDSKELSNKVANKNKSHDEDDTPLFNFKINSKETNIVSINISDDEDILVNKPLNIKTPDMKETEIGDKFNGEILRQALLQDVKVVIEKIELSPEKVHPKIAINNDIEDDIEMAIEKHKIPKKQSKLIECTTEVPDLFDVVKASNTSDNGKVNTRNRLTFEDDIGDICDDEVMKDLTKECIVDMNLFDEPWFDELAKSITNDDVIGVEDGDMVITIDDDDEEKVAGSGEEETDVYTPSTHHEELIKPGVYRCRKCQQMFPTRFNQIQHEMTHMHIRKPRPVLCEFCDRFIATKKALKDHMASKHRMTYRPKTFQNCTKCGLKYNNYDKHLENYHVLLRCHLCNEGFEAELDRLNHIRMHLVKIKCNQCEFVASEIEINKHQKRFHKVKSSVSSNFNLCEICCLFLKNRQHTQYVFGETVSELGTRSDCEHCGNKFFHLTQVRRIVKGRQSDRFTYEKERDKKKVLTNKERLKNIQQRLKMINKLSRF